MQPVQTLRRFASLTGCHPQAVIATVFHATTEHNRLHLLNKLSQRCFIHKSKNVTLDALHEFICSLDKDNTRHVNDYINRD